MKPPADAIIVFLCFLFGGCSLVFHQRSLPDEVNHQHKKLPQGTYYLELISNHASSVPEIQDGLTTMVIDLHAGTISGFAGCNRYQTTVKLAGDSIITGIIMATKKACPGLEFEQIFLSSLGNNRFRWQTEGERLRLISAGTEMNFRR